MFRLTTPRFLAKAFCIGMLIMVVFGLMARLGWLRIATFRCFGLVGLAVVDNHFLLFGWKDENWIGCCDGLFSIRR